MMPAHVFQGQPACGSASRSVLNFCFLLSYFERMESCLCEVRADFGIKRVMISADFAVTVVASPVNLKNVDCDDFIFVILRCQTSLRRG